MAIIIDGKVDIYGYFVKGAKIEASSTTTDVQRIKMERTLLEG